MSCGCNNKPCAPYTTSCYEYPVDCVRPECDEYYSMACVAYTGPDIPYLNIVAGQRMDEVVHKLIQAITDFNCADNPSNDCKAVFGVRIGSVTSESIQLSWNSSLTNVSYEVQYKKSSEDDTAWVTSPPVTVLYTTLENLDANTSYDFRIQTVCNGSNCLSIVFSLSTLNSI